MHAQATKEDIDVVICDTSGRLHTNVGLMEELAKCRRSITKRLEGAPHEPLLILDGTTGASLGFVCDSTKLLAGNTNALGIAPSHLSTSNMLHDHHWAPLPVCCQSSQHDSAAAYVHLQGSTC